MHFINPPILRLERLLILFSRTRVLLALPLLYTPTPKSPREFHAMTLTLMVRMVDEPPVPHCTLLLEISASVFETGLTIRSTFFLWWMILVKLPGKSVATTWHSSSTTLFSPPQIYQPFRSIFVFLSPTGRK